MLILSFQVVAIGTIGRECLSVIFKSLLILLVLGFVVCLLPETLV